MSEKNNMKFDREGEFDRLMEEIIPMSIPANFVKKVKVTLKTGPIIELTGPELLHPLPMMENLGWDKLSKKFENIEDVEVMIDVPAIKQNVVMNVKNILSRHFENQQKK